MRCHYNPGIQPVNPILHFGAKPVSLKEQFSELVKDVIEADSEPSEEALIAFIREHKRFNLNQPVTVKEQECVPEYVPNEFCETYEAPLLILAAFRGKDNVVKALLDYPHPKCDRNVSSAKLGNVLQAAIKSIDLEEGECNKIILETLLEDAAVHPQAKKEAVKTLKELQKKASTRSDAREIQEIISSYRVS